SAMRGFGAKLEEIAPLDSLQDVGDAVQGFVVRGVVAQGLRRALAIAIISLETGAVALAPETAKPDARLLAAAAAIEPDRPGLEGQAEDLADADEIVKDELVPIVLEAALAIPGPGFLLGGFGEFAEPIDGGFDDLR